MCKLKTCTCQKVRDRLFLPVSSLFHRPTAMLGVRLHALIVIHRQRVRWRAITHSLSDPPARNPLVGRFVEKARRVCRLPEQDRGRDLCLPAEPMMLLEMPRKPPQQAPMEVHVLCHRARSPQPPLGLVEMGAATVAIVQPEKLPQSLSVAMFERGRAHQSQRLAARSPAVAEVAVLGARPEKRGSEAPSSRNAARVQRMLLLVRK